MDEYHAHFGGKHLFFLLIAVLKKCKGKVCEPTKNFGLKLASIATNSGIRAFPAAVAASLLMQNNTAQKTSQAIWRTSHLSTPSNLTPNGIANSSKGRVY